MTRSQLTAPYWLLIPVLAATVLAAGCAGGGSQASDGASTSGAEEEADGPEAPPVEVTLLARGPMEAVLRFTSDLEAEQAVPVHSLNPASRRLVELLVEEGYRVGRGQLMARLEDHEPRLSLARVTSQLEKARRDHSRLESLFQQQLIAEQAYTEARHELDQLELAAEDARRQLSYTEVRSPIAGTVATRQVKLGDQVSHNQQLFEVVDFDSLVVRVFVPERELHRVRVGQEARLTSQARPGQVFPALVERISPVVDPRSGTVRVTLDVPYQVGLLPGMFLEVALVTDVREDALRVPKRALVHDRDQSYVYRLVEGDTVERVRVRPALEDARFVEVAEGLAPGDRVVVAGQAGLREGATVRVVGEAS